MQLQKSTIHLGILGIFTIAGLVIMMKTSEQIDSQVSLADLMRAQSPQYSNFDPCTNVQCPTPLALGPAKLIGEQEPNIPKNNPYGGNKICQCPDGTKIIEQPSIPKRFS